MTGLGSSNTPRPVVHEVLAVYFLSIVLDSPNWIIFETKVEENHQHIIIHYFSSRVRVIMSWAMRTAGATLRRAESVTIRCG